MPKRVGGTRVGRAHENLGEARLRERHAKSFPTAQQTVGDGIRKKPLPEVPRKPVRRAAIDTTNVVNKLVNQLGDYRKKPSEEIPQSWDDNDPLYKGIDKYQKNHATQIEKYEKKFGAPRNKAEGHNPNYFREEFIKFMANIDANRPDLKYQGSKEARATNPGAATMKLKHFLGKKGMFYTN